MRTVYFLLHCMIRYWTLAELTKFGYAAHSHLELLLLNDTQLTLLRVRNGSDDASMTECLLNRPRAIFSDHGLTNMSDVSSTNDEMSNSCVVCWFIVRVQLASTPESWKHFLVQVQSCVSWFT